MEYNDSVLIQDVVLQLHEDSGEIGISIKIPISQIKDFLDGIGNNNTNSPPISDRDKVVILHRRGWTIKEIAQSLKFSKGEVKLILELSEK